MKVLTFGKHKNEMLETTPESYIKWLATHKKVLSVENRHFSDAAKELLERRAVVATSGNATWNEWNAALIAKPASKSKSNSNDLGLRGNLNVSRGFAILR